MEERTYLLEMIGITKEFPGVKALDSVTFQLEAGSVHALMGENGAGKTTLMRCLFGLYLEDKGNILINGKQFKFSNPKHALEHGVAMVHQELNQVLKRNVMENLWLGRVPTKAGFVLHKKMYNETLKILNELEIDVSPKAIMSTLSIAKRQMVEIAKAISYNAKILVLDEPTSSLNNAEVSHLFKIINKLRAQGCGIVYISHKIEEILQISDMVSVMRDGKMISTTLAEDLTVNQILKQMVGRELTNVYPPKTNIVGRKILEVKNLSARYLNVKDVSFDLNKGEILGFAGLIGAGRTELMHCLFGTATISKGSIYLNGRKIKNANPREAKKNGFALVTEERRQAGIFGSLSVKENIAIASLKKNLIFKIMLSNKKINTNVKNQIKLLKIKVPSARARILSLSGGNQQKTIISRWLLAEPNIFLLDEPARGVDVGAKYEIHQIMIDLAKQGKSVIMVSSDLPELMGVCDRIVVMSNGQIAGEINPKVDTQEKVMQLAVKYV